MNSPEQEFINILYHSLTSDAVKELGNRHYDKGVHISELGCLRKQYLKRLGYRDVPDPESLMVLKFGTAIHEIIQKTLIDNGYIDPEEIEAKPKITSYDLDSSIDSRRIILGNKWYLLDFKSARPKKHKNDKFGFENIVEADPHHVEQVTLYAYATLEEFGAFYHDFPFGGCLVIYFNKNGGTWLKEAINPQLEQEFYQSLQEQSEFNLVFSDWNRDCSIKPIFVPYDEIMARILVKNKIAKYQYYCENYILPPIEPDDLNTCNRLCGLKYICETIKPY